MLLPRLVLAAFVFGSPLLGRAQSSESVSTPRYYVGVAAYTSYYQEIGSKISRDGSKRFPVQFIAGYQLSPRLALQAGVAYSGARYSYDESIYYSGASNSPSYSRYQVNGRSHVTSVSLLSRYTLTRNLAHRVQFDALAGVGLEHGSGYSRSTRSDSIAGIIQTTNSFTRGSRNFFLLTVGGSIRYRLNPRLDLNFDVTANRSVVNLYYTVGFTGSTALGVRYRFGK